MNKYHLSESQLSAWDAVRSFSEGKIAPFAREIDETDEFPHGIFKDLAEHGYMGAPVSPEWGGAGCDAVTMCFILEEISRASGSVGCSYNAHVSLASSVIANHGSPEQKRKYLTALASGAKIGAFGLTEPSGGSNAGDPKTRAVRRGEAYVINGSKAFNTNGWVADIFVITARTDKGVSAFILERGMKGFTIGKPAKKMGAHGSPTSILYFDDVVIPEENLVGDEGTGFRAFAGTLDRARINVAALAVGLAQAALNSAVAYARADAVRKADRLLSGHSAPAGGDGHGARGGAALNPQRRTHVRRRHADQAGGRHGQILCCGSVVARLQQRD